MDAIEIIMMAFFAAFTASVVGVLVFAIGALLVGGYKQGKLFGLGLVFFSFFGLIAWLIGGLVLLLGNNANDYVSAGWRVTVYILIALGFTALLVEHPQLIEKWNNKK